MKQLYNTVVSVWKTETEVIHIPVLGVFGSKEEAERNAATVALQALVAQAPELVQSPVTIVAVAQPDEAVIELLKTLGAERPDLAKHAAAAVVKRGKTA